MAKEDLDNEILNTYLFDIPAEEPAPAEEPPVSSLEALLSLNLSPELREQLEAAHEDLTAVPAEATDVVEETVATSPHYPDDDPSPPDDFHLHISRDVMNSIRLISPSSPNSQPQLWEFLLDLTRVKSLDQAIRLLSTVAMNHKIRDPFARLFDYVAAFTKLRRRLRKLAIPEKQFMLEFLKKLNPESISAALKKSVDFKQITSLSELIQESYSLLTTHLEHSSRLKSVEHLQRQERPQSSRNNFSRNNNFSRTPIRSPRSNPSPYPSTPRSNFSSPTTPKFSTQRSSPNTPDKSSITCFNCNKIGHYANECRSSPARRPYNSRNPTMPKNHNFRNRNTAKVSQPINAPKAHISSLLSDSDSDSPKYSRTSAKGLFQVSQKSPLLELDVLVGQKKVRGLIDTGCIKSCITSDLVDPTHDTIDKSKVSEFEVADGRIVRSLGRFHTKLSLLMGNESPKRIHLEVKLQILEGSNQLLIGCNILKCLGLLTSEGLSIRINEQRNILLTAEDDFDHLIQSPPKAAVAKTSDSSFDDCRIELPSSTEKKLLELLKSKEDAFGPPHTDGIDAPPMSLEYHDESFIVNKPPRKINPARLEIANGIFDELTSAGFAEEVAADCPHGSPIVLVTYHDHRKPRLTGDYSGSDGVNAKSKSIEANLPRISEVIEFLSQANFIATLDLPRAFWQLKIKPEDYDNTTLKVPGRALRFTRAAFGLKYVPAVFQNTMVEVFKDIPNVFIYLDDIIVAAKEEKDFLFSLSLILDRCEQRRVKLGKKKCTFLTRDSEIKILGSIFQNGTRRIDQDRIDAILSIPIPENIHELRSFIGSINYIRDWRLNISCLLKPLTELFKKDERKPESPQKIMKSLTLKHLIQRHPQTPKIRGWRSIRFMTCLLTSGIFDRRFEISEFVLTSQILFDLLLQSIFLLTLIYDLPFLLSYVILVLAYISPL
ncbi:hypothetical protein GEMRC1_010761 [Eukaryota sp. GEM-RC1]